MGTQDYGILITAPGSDTSSATGGQVLMNTSNPFFKMDTQVPTSFQSIVLLITTDPPEPVYPVMNRYTTVASFPHGYNYVPAIEALFTVTSAAPATNLYQQYFQDTGLVAAQTVDDGATLYCAANATNIYFIIQKFNDGIGSANLLTGLALQISLHVFVEGVGI